MIPQRCVLFLPNENFGRIKLLKVADCQSIISIFWGTTGWKLMCYSVKSGSEQGTKLALLRAPLSVLLTVSSSCNLCKARTPLSDGRSQPISIRSPAVQTTLTPAAPQPWNAGSLRGPVGPCLCMRPAQAWSPISLKGKLPTQRRVSPPCNPSHLM